MVDLVITAANVVSGSGSRVAYKTSGATFTAGQVAYEDTTASPISQKLADNNSGTAIIRKPAGIALNAAASGQPLALHQSGPITIGATLVVGAVYCLSDTPGGICPVADLVTGEYLTIIGVATSASVLDVKIHESGVATP